MPSNSTCNDLVKTRKRSVFNCKRYHRSNPSNHVLVVSTRSSFVFKWCHQILWPVTSRSNKCKNICFSFYLIILYHILIITTINDPSGSKSQTRHLQISRALVENNNHEIVLLVVMQLVLSTTISQKPQIQDLFLFSRKPSNSIHGDLAKTTARQMSSTTILKDLCFNEMPSRKKRIQNICSNFLRFAESKSRKQHVQTSRDLVKNSKYIGVFCFQVIKINQQPSWKNE